PPHRDVRLRAASRRRARCRRSASQAARAARHHGRRRRGRAPCLGRYHRGSAMTATALALCLVACWRDGPMPPVPHGPDPLAIELVLPATSFTMAERAHLDVGIRATNLTQRTFDPRLDLCDLLVDGEASADFRAAVGSGAREPEWFKLPAGRTIERAWPLGV